MRGLLPLLPIIAIPIGLWLGEVGYWLWERLQPTIDRLRESRR